MNSREHFSKEEIQKTLELGEQDQLQTMFTHIAICETCSDIFADYMQETQLLKAPKDMKQNIMKQVNERNERLEKQRNKSVIYTRKMKQRHMILYSVKVTLAACAALLVVAHVKVQEDPAFLVKQPKVYEAEHQGRVNLDTSSVSDVLLNFSNRVLSILK